MPVITQIEKSRVIDISGQALIRRANGKLEPVQVGELVPRGAQLLVAEDSWVELRQEIEPRPLAEGLMVASAPVETANDMGNELDRLLDAVSRGDASVVRARLESPRASYATPAVPSGTTRAPRWRQLPTNHGHADRLLGVTRVYQPDSSSKTPHPPLRAVALRTSCERRGSDPPKNLLDGRSFHIS